MERNHCKIYIKVNWTEMSVCVKDNLSERNLNLWNLEVKYCERLTKVNEV